MALTLYNIKKWYRMFTGKSVFHVHQDLGKSFSKDSVEGYYNNLTEKVRMEPFWVNNTSIPTIKLPDGKNIIFPVAVFQYALGLYDLFLQTKQQDYLRKFLQLADWTYNAQDEFGRWDNFSYIYPENPYGAMAQGEAVSVLVRAYIQTSDAKYIECAKRGIDFMLRSVKDGGTSLYEGDDIFLCEYTHFPVVLNGWIFAWWGLYDYVLQTNDVGRYADMLKRSCDTMVKFLPQFCTRHWSKYDLSFRLTSPFYHRLHIAQMQAMFQLTGNDVFEEYATRWNRQLKNPIYKGWAIAVKGWQKIRE